MSYRNRKSETLSQPKVIETRINLVPGQEKLLVDYKTPVLAAICGTGSGKTLLLYAWLADRMKRWSGNTFVIAEPTYNMLEKIIITSSDPGRPDLITFLHGIDFDPCWINKKNLILGTKYGQIYLASVDNPDSMQGAAVKGVALDEAGMDQLLAFQTAIQRTSMMKGQVLITTTPYNMGWLKSEIWDKKGPDIHVETWKSIDRPGFPRESYEYAKKHLPPWRFAMMYDGRFERPAGIIYSAFDENVCLIDRFEIPKHWLIYTAHDFGGANPAAMFYAQDLSTGLFYAWHEYLPGAGLSTYDHVTAFKKITDGYNVIKRAGGNATTEEEIRGNYTSHGWPIQGPDPLNKTKELQIDKVIGLHQLNKVYVFRDLIHYLDEKRSFSRELNDDGLPTERIHNESTYHLIAAERVLFSHIKPETVEKQEDAVVVNLRPGRNAGNGHRELHLNPNEAVIRSYR